MNPNCFWSFFLIGIAGRWGGGAFASSVGTFLVPEAILIYFSRDVIATTTTAAGANFTVFHYHPLWHTWFVMELSWWIKWKYGKCHNPCILYVFEDISAAAAAAAAAKSLQLCLTLCDPIDRSPPGSAVPGILQARTLEWVAISFSNAWKWKVKVKPLSRVRLFATPWTAAHQASPSMGFSRQEYWSGVPLPSPKDITK